MGMFHTTHWSLVMRAAGTTPRARDALAELCRAYRAPVLAYVRRVARAGQQAEDLTQDFFLRLLDRRYYADADPARGRFRTFLLTALQRHLAKLRARDRAVKRGGRVRFASISAGSADAAASESRSPEREFEQVWARTVIQHALERLERDSTRAGKAELFARLRPFLLDQPDRDDYAALADELGLKRNTLAIQVHRMRARLRQLIRSELARTVGPGPELEDELQALRAALGGRGPPPERGVSSPRAAG